MREKNKPMEAIPMDIEQAGAAQQRKKSEKLPIRVILADGDAFRDGGTSPPKDPLMTLAQVVAYLGISIDYGRHVWPEWTQHGVNPIRLNGKPKGPLRFKQSEILALVDSWRVVTK